MITLILIIFACSGVYAIVGNIIVYFTLIHRGIPVRSLWARTPTYLYRICAKATPSVGKSLRRFAFSTDIAFFFCNAGGTPPYPIHAIAYAATQFVKAEGENLALPFACLGKMPV